MRWTSEQAQRRGAVAHQQVFGLLIGIQRHLVRFPPDAGLFIAAERRMSCRYDSSWSTRDRL